MSWGSVLLLCAGSYLLKAGGFFALEGRDIPPGVVQRLELLPPSLLAALVVVQTVGTPSGALVVDARLGGVVVACVAVWCRAPLLVVVLLAMATTALLRALV